jgi:uncharacterized protein
MQIHVESLTETPTPFAFEADGAWWRSHVPADRGFPTEPPEPLQLTLRAYKMASAKRAQRGEAERRPLPSGASAAMGEDVVLEGGLEGALALECGRCLARYRQPLRETFRLVLEPAGSRVPADPEAAAALTRDGLCVGDEFETGWYREGEIHLDSVCLELIALALPVQPLCREDCAGLCPRCGGDRNLSPCTCSDVRPESPFAALAALRVTRGDR